MRPINPPLPLFYAPCVKCGTKGNSLSMAAGDKPFTYVCFACQDDATREAVRAHSNEYVRHLARENPALVAFARRELGLRRPSRTPYSASWEGCGVEQ